MEVYPSFLVLMVLTGLWVAILHKYFDAGVLIELSNRNPVTYLAFRVRVGLNDAQGRKLDKRSTTRRQDTTGLCRLLMDGGLGAQWLGERLSCVALLATFVAMVADGIAVLIWKQR
jgi:hypothetical protein